jgi:uncharacterized protein (TIGR02646 family)
MIRVERGPEPAKLGIVRTEQLTALRALGRDPISDDVEGYRVVAEELWHAQYHKCCYCEARIPKGHNDVEHYRPKAAADRRPGCTSTHGYWWLAYSWDNLLFACPGCNRSHKNRRFPLDPGCQSLRAEDIPPGNEAPLLINPGSTINPVEHIEFVYKSIGRTGAVSNWWARPRNGSRFGNSTIEICGLNRADLREIREDHYATVVIPHSRAMNAAIAAADQAALQREFIRALELLVPRNVHVGLTYDALRYSVPEAGVRALLGIGWPSPNLVAP